jgi:hypothetical protein
MDDPDRPLVLDRVARLVLGGVDPWGDDLSVERYKPQRVERADDAGVRL